MKRAYYFFKQTILKQRLAHLYLISGPKGSGKAELVENVSYLILNQNKPENQHLKEMIKQNIVPNMMIIEPDGLTIKKEQILALQKEFSKTALVSGSRIYIIKNIEKIGTGAANSLL
ncbi:MAG TPA: DNA polymerase III subunit delta', partial [Acholeplasmataceae bacterium]|nr:DNA polymerase III subunit delta' [Acholeplasmataceae bacterium]